MATYEDIYGKRVKFFDSDPTLDSSYEGQVWYNSTTGTLKSVVSFAAWSSQTSLGTNKYGSGFGQTVDASAIAGIQLPPGANTTATEEFNGIGWTTGGSFSNAAYRRAAAGTQTSAFLAGGYAAPSIRTFTENYDGTTWTGGGTIPQPSQFGSAQGPQTAGFYGGAGPDAAEWYDYDGSSYSSAGNQSAPTSRQQRAIVGNAAAQTAAVASGGYDPSPPYGSTDSEEWNGTAFSTTSSTNIGNWARGTGGTSTNAVVFGSAPNNPTPNSSQTATETWDGTSYTTSPATTGTGRTAIQGGAGIGTNALFMGGSTGPGYDALVNSVEEYNLSINTVTAAAWASGGALNVPRVQTYGAGSQTAGLIFGGEGPPGARNQTEEYNGSTWTEVNNMPATNKDHAGFGIQTAAVACGGSPTTTSLNYDGTNWTASPGSLNTGRTNSGGTGTQTAGLTFGGHPNITATEEYNGSSWTTNPNALPAARSNIFAAGTQTAALGAGGGPPTSTAVYEYDGSSWTSGNALPSGTIDARGGGTQTDALYAGGYLHPGSGYPTTTLGYDGTNWSTRPSLATATAGGGAGQSAAPASANWIAGGNPTPAIAVTQEFTGITETVTAKTLTTG
jgi:hypothetical protein